MDVEVSKENICINKLVCEKKEVIFVQNDLIVPDSKPDVLSSINMSGNVCVYKKEVQDDKIKIEGNINTYIMYLPDSKDDKLRALNTSLDFSEFINVAGAKEGMQLELQTSIKDMECKVLNGRKVSVKVGIEVTIKLYSNEEVDIVNAINNIPDIQTLQKDFSINSLVGSGNTKVYVKDTLNIDQKDEIAEILKTDINLINNDIKISYNKILVKSEADVKIMYLTENNRINTVRGKIPVVGFVDLQNISEENICDVNFDIANMIVRPNGPEEHSIYVELEVGANCKAFEKKQINLLQDLYSPTIDLNFNQRRVSTMTSKVSKTKEFTVTNSINMEGISSENVLDVEVRSTINKQQVTSSKIIYEGELEVNFIFEDGNNISSKLAKIPFDYSVENELEDDKINVNTKAIINNTNFDFSGSSVKANIDMTFNIESSKNVNINIIENIQNQENRQPNGQDYDSLILYIVQNGDTLWKIAKKFRSTIDDIVRTNGIEDPDRINVGQKLYIPKFRYMRRESA